MASLVLTQTKSKNGADGPQRDTLHSLGLGTIGKSVERPDTPQLRGMVYRVAHLISVEEKS